MKIQVDIVTGFLDSGKTTYINGMLEEEALSGESLVIIQYESGEIGINHELIKDKNVYIKKPGRDETINPAYITGIIGKYKPDRIIVEYNGMESLDTIFEVLEDRAVRRKCVLGRLVNTIDAATFEIYINNTGPVFIEQLSSSDLIILNKTGGFSAEKLNRMEKTLKAFNKSADIIRTVVYDEGKTGMDRLKASAVKSMRGAGKLKPSDKLLYIFTVFVITYLIVTIFRSVDVSMVSIDLSWLQTLNMVFLSILMQAFPFILIGVFVSSVLQVFISSEILVRIFPKSTAWGFVAAILAGVLFPVCDCAIVPVAARLIKKGVPIPAAITFMLSAPLVNPIVIASTLYAFPGQPSMAAYRIYYGITVALAVGFVFLFFPEKESIVRKDLSNLSCGCGFCGENMRGNRGIIKKVESIFRHAGTEFFEVGRFLIVGALLSSILQILIPKDIFNNLSGENMLSLLVMMTAAFIFSVCSTSDAFIARTFLNQFSAGSVMGFLVLGPMLDIKNTLMLFSSFRKRFVIKLVAVILSLAFVLLYFQTLLLM